MFCGAGHVSGLSEGDRAARNGASAFLLRGCLSFARRSAAAEVRGAAGT
jgi:hypothetical protein